MEYFRPFVRYARKHEQRIPQAAVCAVDHRLFFCHGGSAICRIQGNQYPIQAGTVLYIPGGVPYCFQLGEEYPVLSGCNFDFFRDHRHLAEPIPPVPEKEFVRDAILEKQIFSESSVFSGPLCLGNAFSLEYKFLEIAEEYIRHNLYWDSYCGTLMHAVLIRVAQLWQTRNLGVDDQKGNAILSYIHTHYAQPLTNKQIAEHFRYHENYISELVRKYTGLPLHRYLLRYRMHVAVGLLQSTDMTISEIAANVAMPDIKHFSKCFKQVMGVPTSLFRVRSGS